MSSPSIVHVVEPSAVPGGTAYFSVTGVAEPGLLPRLMEIWAKRGLIPQRWHSVLRERDAPELAVDIEVAGLDACRAELLATEMRCVFGVSQVLLSEKREAVSA